MADFTWFARVEVAAAAFSEGRTIALLVELCARVLDGYPILYSDGMVAKVLSDDLSGNMRKLAASAATDPTATLHTLLASHSGRLRDSESVWGALWCTRTLEFVAELLRALGADADLSIASAGRATYSKTLSRYHAPVFSWLVSFILGWAPTRGRVLATNLSGHDNATVTAACARAAGALTPVVEGLLHSLRDAGADFPDKQSALPFGL